ncbi:MAG: GntR family transcriptional regulator [Eubacteriales bacterium]|nr:GntR family transcriptional regulator [Eubacteriales bacterium]
MIIEIDFDSDEALYMQLRNQIIIGIATKHFNDGDSLPSVRKMADEIGINMHTVNKAYALLKSEGFLTVDRRSGAIIKVDINEEKTRQELLQALQLIVAKASCKNISRREVHRIVDSIYDSFQ